MTTGMRQLDTDELKGLLLRNWMTHDAMWFASAVAHHGIEEANSLNRAAVRSMAAIEAKRIVKLFGLGPVETASDIHTFFDHAIANVIPDFMDFAVVWASGDASVSFEITRCFAFDGVTALGVADSYECGIYERIYGWLDALGVEYSVSPGGTSCRMCSEGICARTFTFSRDGADGPPGEEPLT